MQVAFAEALGCQAGVHGLCRHSWLGVGWQLMPLAVCWRLHCSEVAWEPKETGWIGSWLKHESTEVAGDHGRPGSCLHCQSHVCWFLLVWVHAGQCSWPVVFAF